MDPFYIDWADHPQMGRVPPIPPRAVNVGLQHYVYDVQGSAVRLTIDIASSRMRITRCMQGAFDGNLPDAEGVLTGNSKTAGGPMAVHLQFSPALRRVGAPVSAAGAMGLAYQAMMEVLCTDGSRGSFSANGVLSRNRGTAPFLGAAAAPGAAITDVWLDAAEDATMARFASVAIGDLLWDL